MSDKIEPIPVEIAEAKTTDPAVKPAEKPVEKPPIPAQSFGYPWMGVDSKGLLELSPLNLPPMLRRAYAKHKAAAAKKGK